ncbi:PREDICTED: uncharacterized protein LOC104573683 [Tinamus guttatus]|uniref:uncharacterized protein LOC104573683 n=1 Tax=Tinamus guttatus TaxID=94827 RepID=UPI00052EB9D5|nr:PREDICTED: uncharacterized protein LOC104573683 [Tinamus guttatus]
MKAAVVRSNRALREPPCNAADPSVAAAAPWMLRGTSSTLRELWDACCRSAAGHASSASLFKEELVRGLLRRAKEFRRSESANAGMGNLPPRLAWLGMSGRSGTVTGTLLLLLLAPGWREGRSDREDDVAVATVRARTLLRVTTLRTGMLLRALCCSLPSGQVHMERCSSQEFLLCGLQGRAVHGTLSSCLSCLLRPCFLGAPRASDELGMRNRWIPWAPGARAGPGMWAGSWRAFPLPAGTSHVLDACGCCKVCARQLGELCSAREPCDHHKGLYCDAAKGHRGSGICLAHEGATCDLLGKIYHNGESFQPTCKLQCICMVFKETPAQKPEVNDVQENCLVQTTAWSACSKSCGMGISARVTNDNPQCRLEKETRLCMVRPCDFPMEKTKRLSNKMPPCHYDCPRDNDIFLATHRRRMIGDHVRAERQ